MAQRGLLRSFVAGFDGTREREMACRIILMALMADGPPEESGLNRVAHAIHTEPDLQGLDWDDVQRQIAEIEHDAPLFFETRTKTVRHLPSSTLQRTALSLAAKIAAGSRTLPEASQAMLDTLADEFGIEEEERAALLAPWDSEESARRTLNSTAFNDPTTERPVDVFDAIARSTSPLELGMLLYKLRAIRVLLDGGLPLCRLLTVGERVKVGKSSVRVDAQLRSEGGPVSVRFLARNETMHGTERELIGRYVGRLEAGKTMLFVYQDHISHPDASFLQTLNPDRFEQLHVDA